MEYEADQGHQAQTKDRADSEPAEERTCTRGRCMRMLKIGESRTRMRGREDSLSDVRLGFSNIPEQLNYK